MAQCLRIIKSKKMDKTGEVRPLCLFYFGIRFIIKILSFAIQFLIKILQQAFFFHAQHPAEAHQLIIGHNAKISLNPADHLLVDIDIHCLHFCSQLPLGQSPLPPKRLQPAANNVFVPIVFYFLHLRLHVNVTYLLLTLSQRRE